MKLPSVCVCHVNNITYFLLKCYLLTYLLNYLISTDCFVVMFVVVVSVNSWFSLIQSFSVLISYLCL